MHDHHFVAIQTDRFHLFSATCAHSGFVARSDPEAVEIGAKQRVGHLKIADPIKCPLEPTLKSFGRFGHPADGRSFSAPTEWQFTLGVLSSEGLVKAKAGRMPALQSQNAALGIPASVLLQRLCRREATLETALIQPFWREESAFRSAGILPAFRPHHFCSPQRTYRASQRLAPAKLSRHPFLNFFYSRQDGCASQQRLQITALGRFVRQGR